MHPVTRVKCRPPHHPFLGPRTLANDVAVVYSLHHVDVASVRLGSPLVLDPDFFGLQEFDCRDVVLIVAAVVVVPAQTEDPRRIVARREVKIVSVDVGERRRTRQRWHPADYAGLCSSPSPQL
jgi:hypothetical protein